jgi:WD40 repeat protein
VRATNPDCRIPRFSPGRLIATLLLLCCLIAALCGPVSAADEEYASLWDKGANDIVSSVAVTRDGSLIVAGAGTVVYLMDQDGNVLWKTTVGSRVNGVGISPEGTHIGVAADKLYLFDLDGDLLWSEKTNYIYWDVALSSNGTYVAATCDNGAVFVFDQNKKALWDYDMGTDGYSIAMSENGRKIAVGCDNKGVYYLNSRDGESWSYGTGKLVKSVSVTRDGRFVAAGSLDRCVYLSTGEGEHLWKYPMNDAVLATALTDEAAEILAASGKTVHVIDDSGFTLQRINIDGRVEAIDVTPDGSFLVVGGGEGDRSIHFYTRDADLVESMNLTEVEEAETGEAVGSPTPLSAHAAGEIEPAAVETNVPAPEEEESIASLVLGWVENVLSLLFKPQEDFIA